MKIFINAFERLKGRFDFKSHKEAEAKLARSQKGKRPPKRRRKR